MSLGIYYWRRERRLECAQTEPNGVGRRQTQADASFCSQPAQQGPNVEHKVMTIGAGFLHGVWGRWGALEADGMRQSGPIQNVPWDIIPTTMIHLKELWV